MRAHNIDLTATLAAPSARRELERYRAGDQEPADSASRQIPDGWASVALGSWAIFNICETDLARAVIFYELDRHFLRSAWSTPSSPHYVVRVQPVGLEYHGFRVYGSEATETMG
jgi:hypothetical protein